ncbi:Chemotaxis protein CheY [Myxococcaceae bacterium]|nr:Chemotaxis protein CheY [Myxococcaceae bacterium]
MRALVVDPSKAARTHLRRILEDAGFEAGEASEGLEALELVRKAHDHEPYELLVLEWHSGDLSGLDLARTIRAEAGARGPRPLMVSHETTLAHVRAALAAGVDEYAMKPFTREVIFEKLALLGLVVP